MKDLEFMQQIEIKVKKVFLNYKDELKTGNGKKRWVELKDGSIVSLHLIELI